VGRDLLPTLIYGTRMTLSRSAHDQPVLQSGRRNGCGFYDGVLWWDLLTRLSKFLVDVLMTIPQLPVLT
jgi:ABC-type dipeptide/oligopeptide/nickel transport system permease subunit